jgi:hypothetical protein
VDVACRYVHLTFRPIHLVEVEVWVVGGDVEARGEQDEVVGAQKKNVKNALPGLVARVRDAGATRVGCMQGVRLIDGLVG